MSLSLHNRNFIPVENTAAGVVDDRTEFKFSQDGTSFNAVYSGGNVKRGHIIGRFIEPELGEMLYHCETQEGILKAGRADAVFSLDENDLLTMSLDWEWVSGADGSGTSKYIELQEPRT